MNGSTVHVIIMTTLYVVPCVDNVDECVNGECTCKPGYLSPDCCKCDKNYYKDPVDKKCKRKT